MSVCQRRTCSTSCRSLPPTMSLSFTIRLCQVALHRPSLSPQHRPSLSHRQRHIAVCHCSNFNVALVNFAVSHSAFSVAPSHGNPPANIATHRLLPRPLRPNDAHVADAFSSYFATAAEKPLKVSGSNTSCMLSVASCWLAFFLWIFYFSIWGTDPFRRIADNFLVLLNETQEIFKTG